MRFILENRIFAYVENRVEHIERLKRAVVAAFGQTLDSPTDYERLSADIQHKTGELISVSTLKRLFGYTKPGTTPRPSTLSVLARYVGCAGWSDFCSGCSGEADLEPCETPVKAARRHLSLYGVVAMLSLVVLLGFAAWSLVRDDGEQGPRSGRGEELPGVVSDAGETDVQKYERLLFSFVALSKERCDSVRACRQNMDIISYRELVDSVYYPFVFTLLQDSIKRQMELVFPDDELLRVRYGNDIWVRCREICADLMREIPSDELLKAYNAAASSTSAH